MRVLKKILLSVGSVGGLLCVVASVLKVRSYMDILLFISPVPTILFIASYALMPVGIFVIAWWYAGKKPVRILLWFSFALSLFPLFMQLFGDMVNNLITALKSTALLLFFSGLDLLSLVAVGAAVLTVKNLSLPAKIVNLATGAAFFAYAVYQGFTYVDVFLPSLHPYDFMVIFTLLAASYLLRAFWPEKSLLGSALPSEPAESVL